MAFNPFTSFRKHQKVWMASVLLLCMVTFVLCTGVGGDLSERLLRMFAPRHGTAIGELDRRTVYFDELSQLRSQRKLADRFMRMAMETVLSRISDALSRDDGGTGKGAQSQREFARGRLGQVQAELKQRLSRPRYFDGDLKLESLLDFMLWLKQADRLEVNLTTDSVTEMFYREIFALVPTGGNNREQLFVRSDERRIFYDMRRDFPGLSAAMVYEALMNEYRARIAQLALYQAQEARYKKTPNTKDRNLLLQAQMLKFRPPEPEIRELLSPAQLWDIYKQKRTQYDVSLVPVRVAAFRDKVKDPDTDKLKSFFEAHKSEPYDPAASKPGFEVPQMVKIEWIMADPTSAAYEQPAQIISLLEANPPALPVIAPFSALANAVQFAGAAPAFDASMLRNYEAARRTALDPRFGVDIQDILEQHPRGKYLAAPLTAPAAPALLGYLGKPTPAGVASAVGAAAADPLASLAPYRAEAAAGVPAKLLGKLLAEENEPRVQLAAALVSLAPSSPFAAPAIWFKADRTTRFLPLIAVQSEFKKGFENQLSRTWTAANMAIVKDKLDPAAGNDRALSILAPKLVAQYGLQHGVTQKLYNRFEIGDAPELAPLRDGFERDRFTINQALGTMGTPDMYKEGDFYKLFFGASDAGRARYVVRPWPPILDIKEDVARGLTARKVSLFEQAGKPILFWMTEETYPHTPETLDSVRGQVVAAWKTKKARDEFALPRAKEIAQALLKSGGEFAPIIRAEAKKLDVAPIDIRGLAVLHPSFQAGPQVFGQGRGYAEYPLPKELITDKNDDKLYPREDMVKQLLALTRLEKPIKTGFNALDELNKQLFDVTKKLPEAERTGKFVQVFTNRPHTMFWVGAVVGKPRADLRDFVNAYKNVPIDSFIAVAQKDAAERYREALLQQLRRDMGYKISASDKERKSFDTGD